MQPASEEIRRRSGKVSGTGPLPLRSTPPRPAEAGSQCGAGRSRHPDVVFDLPGRYFWDLREGFGKLDRVRAGKVAGEGGRSRPWQVLLRGSVSGRAVPRALALPGGWCVSGSGGSSATPASCGAVAEVRVPAGERLLELSGRCQLPAVGWDRGAPEGVGGAAPWGSNRWATPGCALLGHRRPAGVGPSGAGGSRRAGASRPVPSRPIPFPWRVGGQNFVQLYLRWHGSVCIPAGSFSVSSAGHEGGSF